MGRSILERLKSFGEALAASATKVAAKVAALKGWHRWAAAFLAGVLAVASLAPFFIVPALLVSFPVLIWLLDAGASQAKPLRAAVAIGWWFGFGYHLAGLYWMSWAFLVDPAFIWLLPLAAVVMPAGLALFSAASAMAAKVLFDRVGGWARVAGFVVIWMSFEWLRGHVLTGLPWNLNGYALASFLPLAQSASLFGIYGLSLVTVLVAASPAALVEIKSARPEAVTKGLTFMATGLGLLAVLTIFGAQRLSTGTPQFVDGVVLRIVQPSIPQREKWKAENRRAIFQKYLELSQAPSEDLAGSQVSHIIWPESAVPLYLARQPTARAAIARSLKDGQWLLTGAVRMEDAVAEEPRKYFNSFFMLDTQGVIRATYDKYHLVPFGEYLPGDDLLQWLGVRQLVPSEGGYTSGPGPRTLEVPGAGKVLPMICYEAIFPGRLRRTLQGSQRPDWILNVTNDAWYGRTSEPSQHFNQARMRAIEEGLPLVRSANTGISGVFDPYGRSDNVLQLNEVGFRDAALPSPLPPTLYAKLGDWVFAAMMTFLAGVAVLGAVPGLRSRN
jgi:apolipoprotein N-acyltransferase